jgi:hypothetical protein
MDAFEIRDDAKFILNAAAAEWVAAPWFVQFQVADDDFPSASFRLCMNMHAPNLRRLSCTIHDKDTGAWRGVHVLDDSQGLGVVEYAPITD